MIYRIDVRARLAKGDLDHAGEAVRHQIAQFGMTVGPISTRRIFLIDADATTQQVRQVADELLADPVVEVAEVVTAAPSDSGVSRIEVHPKPGVMDPVAASTEMAIRDMGIAVRAVRTGRAFLIEGQVPREQLERIAYRVLANGVIESVHFSAFIPAEFPQGHARQFEVRRVPIRNLSDAQLTQLSRDGHLFLSLTEMKAIQAHYQQLQREPTDVELETLAQTWSEHCVHKTLKSAVELEVRDGQGKVLETRRYKNLIKETIFKATMELMAEGTEDSPSDLRASVPPSLGAFCLSVFKDNAGVIAFDDTHAVCFKVETHNRPSAIDPYGGSATGVGGVIRDVLGTGLAAKPIANTDIFCVAMPETPAADIPRGVLHPKRILQQVVAGVRDYGNRMGIPTVNGAVYFDQRYLANPLVFCGCVGLIPRSRIEKQARPGDAIVVMGGRTGRDGIHGATFSSAELTSTHADEFSHAVQIGNAIEEKRVTDVVLQAADRDLFTAITDCGAGGLSSACGEMGGEIGAEVNLETIPLKYAGLRYDEIWISEAQERMVLAVPQEKVKEILALAAAENVEATVIGTFGNAGKELVLRFSGTEVARMSMAFIHDGIPMPTRRAVAPRQSGTGASPVQAGHGRGAHATGTLRDHLLASLAHPNIASKHWIIRQYDHEVQGGSVIKPLTGPRQVGPSDAAVIRPKLSSYRGVALGCGLTPQIEDPYEMAIWAIDEAVRNVVAVGADPSRIAMLDNFCWPGTHDEASMGALARTCEACYDASKAYRIPFISGKDSLHNQFTDKESGRVIRIPNTLLISTIAVLQDVRNCVTMDLKGGRDSVLAMVRPTKDDLATLPRVHAAMARAMADGHVLACHDISDGGWLTAAAEMAIASGLGLTLERDPAGDYFTEFRGGYLIEIDAQGQPALNKLFAAAGASMRIVGRVDGGEFLSVGITENRVRKNDCQVSIADMTKAWRGTLDW